MVSLLQGWGYCVSHKVIDTRKQGIPQSRPRFYLVGIHREKAGESATWFKFPGDIEPPEPIEDFLDVEDPAGKPRSVLEGKPLAVCKAGLEMLVKKGKAKDPTRETCVVDVFSTPAWSTSMRAVSPCLTATRCKAGGHYVSTRRGLMTRAEMCRLQGIPPGRFKPEQCGVPEKKFLHAVGNAMSANVLVRLLPHVLHSANLTEVKEPPLVHFAVALK